MRGGFYFYFQIYSFYLIFYKLAFEVYEGRAQLLPSSSHNDTEIKLPLIDNKIAVNVKKVEAILILWNKITFDSKITPLWPIVK